MGIRSDGWGTRYLLLDSPTQTAQSVHERKQERVQREEDGKAGDTEKENLCIRLVLDMGLAGYPQFY